MSSASSDTDELEALFDSIVAENTRKPDGEAVPEPPPAPVTKPSTKSTAKAGAAVAEPSAPVATDIASDESNGDYDVISRIGQLTRTLHDSMRELGYDKIIAKTADGIPDTRDRLGYIATMTESAASRTLNATEAAQPLQEELHTASTALSREWDRLFDNALSVDEFKELASRTRDFLKTVPVSTQATQKHLFDIMMAQDFQDLTGQVIKKMNEMTRQVEQQLLALLVENAPSDRREQLEASGLAGPTIGKAGADAVDSQQQVDDLLESLGF